MPPTARTNVGNRLSRISSLPGIANQSFSYDANDRLKGDQYDNNGNTRSAPVSQPPGAPEPGVGGSTIRGADNYDSENRLTQRSGTSGSNVTLVYDGDGNRVSQTVNGQTTSYLVGDRNSTGYAQVVEELVNGSVNHTYTYGHDLISQDQVDPATNTWHANFYAYDGHGNVRFLTNEGGQVTDTYVYDAFGTMITATGTTNNRYLYTGEQFDPTLGLYYLRARLMNPLTGRFWTQDGYEGIQGDPTSLHKYLYCGSDPTDKVDPSGHMGTLDELGLVLWNIGQQAATAAPRTTAALGIAFRAITVASLLYALSDDELRQDMFAMGPDALSEVFVVEGRFALQAGGRLFKFLSPSIGAREAASEWSQVAQQLRSILNAKPSRTVALGQLVKTDGTVASQVTASGKNAGNAAGLVLPENPIFTAQSFGEYDAERKLFEAYAQTLKDTPNVSGTLKIFIDHPEGAGACPSCESVAAQFKRMFPNIDVKLGP